MGVFFGRFRDPPFLKWKVGHLGGGARILENFALRTTLGSFSFFGCVLLLAVKVKRQKAFLAQGKQEAASC